MLQYFSFLAQGWAVESVELCSCLDKCVILMHLLTGQGLAHTEWQYKVSKVNSLFCPGARKLRSPLLVANRFPGHELEGFDKKKDTGHLAGRPNNGLNGCLCCSARKNSTMTSDIWCPKWLSSSIYTGAEDWARQIDIGNHCVELNRIDSD